MNAKQNECKTNMPRANLQQKVGVLDYFHGPPQRTQAETLQHFRATDEFSISQATLSSWIVNEPTIRSQLEENPNLVNYRKKPVMKYPDVTRAVENYIDENCNRTPITDHMLKDIFHYYLGVYGYDKSKISLSSGMLHSFKKRNSIKKGVKIAEKIKEDINPPPPPPQAYDILDGGDGVGFNTRLLHSDDNFLFSNFLFPNDPTSKTPPETIQISTADQGITQNIQPFDFGGQKPYSLENFTYSRTTHPNSEKVEKILQTITNGYVAVYNSGTSAIMGILTFLNPKKIAINNSGYQGTHQVIKLLSKLTSCIKCSLNEWEQLEAGDVIILETPMNPEGYCLDIGRYAQLAHSRGAILIVDSTLAPPPLQDPFRHEADYILHSATKYFSGHSDLLAGFVVCKTKQAKEKLLEERFSLGTNIANFDAFLLLRSLRTFKMRILQQCLNTEKLIVFICANLQNFPSVVKVHHSSLQMNEFVQGQLNGYYNPVFALEMTTIDIAKQLLRRFKFLNNNSIGGGVETIVELTNRNPNFGLAKHGFNGNLLRFSVGCEDFQDLINDIDQALRGLT